MSRVSSARLCAFTIGIQFVWGAVLAVELQTRIIGFLPGPEGINAYAIVAALGAGAATMVQLMAGDASDRLRRRGTSRQLFYAAGVACSVPAIVWLFTATDLAGIATAFVLLEVAMNVAGGPYQAIIPDYVEIERRGIASSWMSAYQSLGNAAGLLVAAAVANFRAVATILSVVLVAAYATTASYARTLRPAPYRVAETSRATRSLAALLFSRGLINVGFFTLLGFLAFYVRDSLHVVSGMRETTGIIFTVFTLCAVAGAAASARATDRYDKRLVISVSVAVVASALGVLTFASSIGFAYLGAIVAGIAWGAFATADWALATATLPTESMATSMGIWNVATTMPQVIAPLATAPLVTLFDRVRDGLGPRAAIALALIEFVLGGIAIWLVPSPSASARDAGVEQIANALRDDGRGVGMA